MPSPYPNTTGDLVEYLTKPWGRVTPCLILDNEQTDSKKGESGEKALILSTVFVVQIEAGKCYKCSDKDWGYFSVDRFTYGSCLGTTLEKGASNCLGH